ncbi:hypothetical protein [Candidatus Bathycorpusculum sp.]|jgi:hypothetical protein|uniref:hypothetical protein n=1 Tax=Candidatus Bathycorpusculum sp. TaxID=2994959 RepID=UPI002831E7CC|nr:hypothetical protein [Candidatus Termitimicrobium sp.]MCL2686143.1 hypothetical protein [Candidatus Termitimicrobium sp.]
MLLQGLLIQIVVIPAFLFLSVFLPQTQALFIPIWLACLFFDLSSTCQFYLEDPNKFQINERNKLFSGLTEKFGFKKAALIFPIAIEIPLLMFFALIPLQILQFYLFSNTSHNIVACITASFGISAIGHLQAATKNTLRSRQ